MSLPDLTNDEVARYARHLILEDVGMDGQRKLKAGSVLCVGTGGLGSPLLLYLAAAGVGRIGIVDFDVVDESNLQRQIIHGTSKVGVRKVVSAEERIRDINPFCQVDVYEEALSSANALEILEPYDVVVDGTDNFPTRYLVNDACVILGKPNVYGSIFKFEGPGVGLQSRRRGPSTGICTPSRRPRASCPPAPRAGCWASSPGVIGCIQATETIKILLGKGTSLSGRLLVYDALAMSFRELKLRKDPEPPAPDRADRLPAVLRDPPGRRGRGVGGQRHLRAAHRPGGQGQARRRLEALRARRAQAARGRDREVRLPRTGSSPTRTSSTSWTSCPGTGTSWFTARWVGAPRRPPRPSRGPASPASTTWRAGSRAGPRRSTRACRPTEARVAGAPPPARGGRARRRRGRRRSPPAGTRPRPGSPPGPPGPPGRSAGR